MRTPISYYGGKQRMVDYIVPLIPPHRIYVEPFFGGGAVFWAKGKSFLEVINDINHNVVNFYQVMVKDFDRLLVEVMASPMSEHLHKTALQIYKSPRGHSKVRRAWAFWYVTNCSFANKPGAGWKFDSGSEGSHSGRYLKRRRNEFELYRDRLSEVHISMRDAVQVIGDRDQSDCFFYLDPPYPNSDQGHYKGYTEDDLEKLLAACESISGKFILSNYGSQMLDRYVDRNGWYEMQFEMRLSAPRKKKQRKREILIMNFQPDKKLF